MRETLRLLGSKLVPHDTRNTTCPPAQLVSGSGPLVIVTSMMRSGTHLLLDSLFNNFPAMRRCPLFLDFDAYERGKLPVAPLADVKGMTVKTHYPQTELAGPYASALAAMAGRAVVLAPRRSGEEIRRSLAKWGMEYSVEEFAELERSFSAFWAPYAPVQVDFATLLDPVKMKDMIKLIADRTGLPLPERKLPIMPARHRYGAYFDKGLTRLLGSRAPRINTTIGYRLGPRQAA
ncbi:MAG: pgi [Pedosphaera sp.]|nr:pgi [Pedosphaera sp.]